MTIIKDRILLDDRNKIFKEVGILTLEKNGFVKSPFLSSWYGEYDQNISGYSYELGRISHPSNLEIITASIVNGDKWIKIFLNIFKLKPNIESISQLKNFTGINFHLNQNTSTKMRLRSDDYKGPPIFYMLFLPEYKIGRFSNKNDYEKRIEKLRKLIRKDMENIDSFVKRWYELHQPMHTDWEGKKIE